MELSYEKKDEMTFIGYHTEIKPDEGFIKCPEFWNKEFNEKYARLWMFAICSCNGNGFTYWIAGLYQGGEVPEGLELYSFPASEWAVFTAKGPMPDSLQALTTQVWQEWFPTEGKNRQANDMATLEVYSVGDPQSPDYESGIWVPVK